MEIPDSEIRQLGNWSVSILDIHYSTKLPLRAMKAAAGFNEGQGMFFCPRSTVEPPEELAKLLFPFADEQLANVDMARMEHCATKGMTYLGSAKCFLEMLIRMRTIILQDIAAMMVECPERMIHHLIIGAMPSVFQSDAFKVRCVLFDCCIALCSLPKLMTFVCLLLQIFTEQMRLALRNTQNAVDTNVEAAMPGVNRQFEAL